jgi:hypothetical protein
VGIGPVVLVGVVTVAPGVVVSAVPHDGTSIKLATTITLNKRVRTFFIIVTPPFTQDNRKTIVKRYYLQRDVKRQYSIDDGIKKDSLLYHDLDDFILNVCYTKNHQKSTIEASIFSTYYI